MVRLPFSNLVEKLITFVNDLHVLKLSRIHMLECHLQFLAGQVVDHHVQGFALHLRRLEGQVLRHFLDLKMLQRWNIFKI